MAPKGNGTRKLISQLGSIVPNRNGWRVKAPAVMQDGKYKIQVYGPTRQHKRDAHADLERARAVQTRKEYCDVLSQLTIAARQGRVGNISAHGKGWRVIVNGGSRQVYGPCRVNKCDADADLQQIRTGKSWEECRSILLKLNKGTRSITSNGTEEESTSRKRTVSVSRLGIVTPHGNGWRVTAAPVHGTIVGPYRANESAADADLKYCRAAKTREEYRSNLLQLKLAAAQQALREYQDIIRRLRKTIQTSAGGDNNDTQARKYVRNKEHASVSDDVEGDQ